MLFIYLFIACSYLGFLSFLIIRDKESSLKDSIHFKVAIVASIFWPVVIPISLLKLKLKSQDNLDLDYLEQSAGFQPNQPSILDPVEDFYLDDDIVDSRFEIKPNFNKFEIILNNLLLILFTIIAGIMASCVSLSFILSIIKSYYHKITQKISS